MADLADDLLADLEGLSDAEEEEQQEPEQEPSSNPLKRKADDDADMSEPEEGGETGEPQEIGGLILPGGVKPAEELDAEDVQQMALGGVEDVSKIAKLDGSKRMNELLKVRVTAVLRCQELIAGPGSREIPGKSKLPGSHGPSRTSESRIQCHRPGQQLVGRYRQ